MSKLDTASQAEQNLLFEMLGSSLSIISIGDKVKYPTKIFKTKPFTLDNSPLIVTGRESDQQVQVFNVREHVSLNVYLSSLQTHSDITLDLGITATQSLVTHLLSPNSSNQTRIQIIKYLLLNSDKLGTLEST